MKKLTLLLIVFTIGALNLIKAQDTIVFKSNELKIVKVTQVKSNEIICKSFSNLEGPDYIYEIAKIKEIRYHNGSVEVYNLPDDEVEYVNDIPVKKYEEITPATDLPNVKKLNTYSERCEYYKGVHYHREFGDPYNLWVAGIASYFVPGLGQMVSGETGRGFAFLGGFSAAYIVTIVGVSSMYATTKYDYNYDYPIPYSTPNQNSTGSIITIGGGLAMLGIYIWSIVDAVNVARVNNLYDRDLRKNSQLNLQLTPFIDARSTSLSLNNKPAVGLSLKLNF